MFLKRKYMPLLLIAPMLWGGNFVVGRHISPGISAEVLNLLRWTIAAIALLPFGVVGLFRERIAIRDNFPKLVLLSLLGVIGFNTTLYFALQHISATQAAVGFAVTPFAILILGACIERRFPAQRCIFAAVISFVGLLLVFRSALLNLPNEGRFGIALFMLPPVIIWSLYCISLKRFRLSVTPLTGFLAQILIGIALQGSYIMVTFTPPGGGLKFDPQTILALLYLGLFAAALAFLCWQLALKQFSAAEAGIAMNIVPLSGVLLAWVFLGEPISGIVALGLGLVFGGLFLSSYSVLTQKPAHESVD